MGLVYLPNIYHTNQLSTWAKPVMLLRHRNLETELQMLNTEVWKRDEAIF